MDDGEWFAVVGADGNATAAVCIKGHDGAWNVLNEHGERLLPVGDDEFAHVASGKRYRRRAPGPSATMRFADYHIAFEPTEGCVRLSIDGDFRQASSVDRAWDEAFARLGDAHDLSRVLILRGPGRMASDLVKLQQLQRFSDRGHRVDRIAAVLPPGETDRCAMFVTVAELRGLSVRVFDDEAAAQSWLRA